MPVTGRNNSTFSQQKLSGRWLWKSSFLGQAARSDSCAPLSSSVPRVPAALASTLAQRKELFPPS
jgi:hypothetical protein